MALISPPQLSGLDQLGPRFAVVLAQNEVPENPTEALGKAGVKTMNMVEGEFDTQCAWSDHNAAFVCVSEETHGIVMKLIDFCSHSLFL